MSFEDLDPEEIEVGDIVAHVKYPDLDYREVIHVGSGWIWLDFQKDRRMSPQDRPAKLPIENYRIIRKGKKK